MARPRYPSDKKQALYNARYRAKFPEKVRLYQKRYDLNRRRGEKGLPPLQWGLS